MLTQLGAGTKKYRSMVHIPTTDMTNILTPPSKHSESLNLVIYSIGSELLMTDRTATGLTDHQGAGRQWWCVCVCVCECVCVCVCVCFEGLGHTPSRLCSLLTPARPSHRGQEHHHNCCGSGGLKPPNHKKAMVSSSELRGNMAFLYSGGCE